MRLGPYRHTCDPQMCRGRVTGNDWSRPELVARYRGWYSADLQARIDRRGECDHQGRTHTRAR